MVPQDPGTRVHRSPDASFENEQARQTLAQTLQDHAASLNDRESGHGEAAVHQQRRQQIIDDEIKLIGQLTRYVRNEVKGWEEQGKASAGRLSVSDIVADTCVAALDQIDQAPTGRGFYHWLRGIARHTSVAALQRIREREHHERSLDKPFVMMHGPDPVQVRLIDILADPNAVLPEEVLEQEDLWRQLNNVLTKLPEHWREVFLLRAIDGWSYDEIADAEGIDHPEVRSIVNSSRTFLQESLRDANFLEAV